jgi:hypothetical protein
MGWRARSVWAMGCVLLINGSTALAFVDRDRDSSAQSEVSSPHWNPALATYNLTSTDLIHVRPAETDGLESQGATRADTKARASGLVETLRSAAVPAPAAWWLLLAGVVGVVGVARRRIA